MSKRPIDGRHCASCGYPIYQYEDEQPYDFMRRQTCRIPACITDNRLHGRRHPEYRETAAVETAQAPPMVATAAMLAAAALRRSMGANWLLQPVDNAVENRLTI